jgi:hypothetical protein
MIKITIRECKESGRVWESRHGTDDADEAVLLAVKKHFGPRSGFYTDRGLTVDPSRTLYGQIGHQLRGSNGTSTMDTDRVRVDIEPIEEE